MPARKCTASLQYPSASTHDHKVVVRGSCGLKAAFRGIPNHVIGVTLSLVIYVAVTAEHQEVIRYLSLSGLVL